METLFNSIIEQIKEMEKEQSPFILPDPHEHPITEYDYESSNHIINGKKYIIGDESENIIITHETINKDRVFQPNPDVILTTIIWSKEPNKKKLLDGKIEIRKLLSKI